MVDGTTMKVEDASEDSPKSSAVIDITLLARRWQAIYIERVLQ